MISVPTEVIPSVVCTEVVPVPCCSCVPRGGARVGGGAAVAALWPAARTKLSRWRSCQRSRPAPPRSKVTGESSGETRRENTGHCLLLRSPQQYGKTAIYLQHQDTKPRYLQRSEGRGELTQRCYVTVLDRRDDIVREVLYRGVAQNCEEVVLNAGSD